MQQAGLQQLQQLARLPIRPAQPVAHAAHCQVQAGGVEPVVEAGPRRSLYDKCVPYRPRPRRETYISGQTHCCPSSVPATAHPASQLGTFAIHRTIRPSTAAACSSRKSPNKNTETIPMSPCGPPAGPVSAPLKQQRDTDPCSTCFNIEDVHLANPAGASKAADITVTVSMKADSGWGKGHHPQQPQLEEQQRARQRRLTSSFRLAFWLLVAAGSQFTWGTYNPCVRYLQASCSGTCFAAWRLPAPAACSDHQLSPEPTLVSRQLSSQSPCQPSFRCYPPSGVLHPASHGLPAAADGLCSGRGAAAGPCPGGAGSQGGRARRPAGCQQAVPSTQHVNVPVFVLAPCCKPPQWLLAARPPDRPAR